MFSCFCAKKKKSPSLRNSLQKKTNASLHESVSKNPNNNENKLIDASSTMETPQHEYNINIQLINVPEPQATSIKSSTPGKMAMKRVTSIKELENENQEHQQYQYQSQQYQSEQSDESQRDSDTVPYNKKMQASQVSTPKPIKKSQPPIIDEKDNFYLKVKKQFQQEKFKSQYPFSKTPNEQNIKRYFSYDKEITFHSKNGLNRDGIKSSLANPTVDYSKYSQIDKQVSSSGILDLDEEMENRLQQLQNQSPQQQKALWQKSSDSCSLKNIIQLTQSKNMNEIPKDKDRLKKLKIKKFQSIQNIQHDFNDLQKAQKQIHKRFYENPKLIPRQNKKKNIKVQNAQQVKKVEKNCNLQVQKEKLNQIDLKQVVDIISSKQNLIYNSIKQQLDSIIDQDIYFSDKEAHKSPQGFQNFRKLLKVEEDENELMNETLEEAENAFNCCSINEEFSRAVIMQHLDLAYKIFQRMTLEQKNTKDLKGYAPVHLAVLSAILDDNCFEFSKKIMHHSDVKLNVQGPTGWNPLQETISYKHIRLSPNIFVAAHKKKIGLIRSTLEESSKILSQMRDFYFELNVKVDSFIPLVSTITPQDTLKITKIGSSLLIDYTLVGYEFLSCKRRNMGFLLTDQSIYALNRSKSTYCDLLQQLDKEEIQLLVVESLQSETKKIQPYVNKIQLKQAKSIFDNQIVDIINSYKAKKFTFKVDYTSKTEKRMPEKLQSKTQQSSPLSHLTTWETYLKHKPQINIKPKNKNKKIQLQMWLSQEFQFEMKNLLKIFDVFSLCNPVAQIISTFLNQNFSSLSGLQGHFPVKIDVPINFSLYFNLEFKGLKFENFEKDTLEIDPNLQKCSRKEFQNIAQSKQKRTFAISAFT